MSAKLAARVKAYNRAAEVAADLFPKMRAALEPWVGRQVIKADGELLKKFGESLPELPSGVGIRAYRTSSNFSLAWTIDTWETGEEFTVYEGMTIYVGNLRDGILESLYDKWDRPPVQTVEDVLTKRAAFKEVEKAYSAAKSALHPFGEHDR